MSHPIATPRSATAESGLGGPATAASPGVVARPAVPAPGGMPPRAVAQNAQALLAGFNQAGMRTLSSFEDGEVTRQAWKVLVVDDDLAIHQVTRMALRDVMVMDRPVVLIHALTGESTHEILRDHPDIALILLDVVMEHAHAGLDLVRYVRNTLGNQAVRIVLRTGQPGQAPERTVLSDYDINDYKEKTELTAGKLYSTVVVSIRAYRDIRALERARQGMQVAADATSAIFATRDLHTLAEKALTHIATLSFVNGCALLTPEKPDVGDSVKVGDMYLLASIGDIGFEPDLQADGTALQRPETKAIAWARDNPQVVADEAPALAIAFAVGTPNEGVLCLRVRGTLDSDQRRLIELLGRNLTMAFDNVLLEREASILARLPGELPQPIMRVNVEGRLLFANSASKRLLDHWKVTPGDILPDPWGARMREILAMDRRLDSELAFDDCVIELSMSPVRELAYVNIFGRDITETRQALSQLQHAAFHDELTGLHNRAYFRSALDTAIAGAQGAGAPLGLILLDLDGFKQINDSAGHSAGDEVLKVVAQRLMLMVRVGDVVARLGGDEYAVLVQKLDRLDELRGLAERLRAGISRPVTINDREWQLESSVGITSYPQDALTGENLMRCADLAMYHAKRERVSGVSGYDGEVHRMVRQRNSLELVMREALKHGGFSVNYQPMVRLSDHRINGVEALCRLRDAEGKFVSPADFIPVAEECGLIEELGDWVLRQALTDTRRWHDMGYVDLRVAVNVSGRQMRDANIAAKVRDALRDTGFNPASLEIELTESVLIGDVKTAVAKLWELRELGAELSVDDFGTGYSSLAYLSSLPVGKLKIDRSFVCNLPDSRDASAIVDAILSLGSSLRLNVVAEGVETQGQAQALFQMGCKQVQGYLFSKPVSAADFERLITGETSLSGLTK